MKTIVVVILIIPAMAPTTGLVFFYCRGGGSIELGQFFNIAMIGGASYLIGALALVTHRRAN